MTDRLQGLSRAEVLRSRERYGSNLLTPPERKSLWRLFFEKFNDPVIRILIIAALLSLGIGFIHNEFAEAIGIFCAIFLATGVAFWFEYDAMKKFDVLNSSNDETPVKVVRDGEVTEIPKHEVVVGDTVILQSGEEVPADGQLVEAVSLKINESTLTGETQTDKTTDPARFDKEATYPSDRVMRGTTVIEGHGVMDGVGRGRCNGVRTRSPAGHCRKRRGDPAEPPVAETLETHRSRGYLAGRRHVRGPVRQRHLLRRAARRRLADDSLRDSAAISW